MALIRKGFHDDLAAREAGQKILAACDARCWCLTTLEGPSGKDVSWVEETFYSIVEPRYRDGLPTIVTTEWRCAALAERVGASVVSRLEDGAWVASLDEPKLAYRRPVV